MADKETTLPVDKSLFTQPNRKNVPISNIILFSDDEMLLKNVTEKFLKKIYPSARRFNDDAIICKDYILTRKED